MPRAAWASRERKSFSCFPEGKTNYMQIRLANCLNKILKSIKIHKACRKRLRCCSVAYPFEVFNVGICLQLAKLKYK